MKRIAIRKFFRAAAAITAPFGDLALALVGFLLLALLAGACGNDVYNIWLSYGIFVYAFLVLLLIVRNAIHRFKWFVFTYPIQIRCPKCSTIVPLQRYGEQRYLDAPVTLYLETFRYQLKAQKSLFYMLAYRPYLQLDCPECGEKHVICPYCHEPIPPEFVVCKYEEPSLCPHCGKKIYTPVPLQDRDNLIKLTDLTK